MSLAVFPQDPRPTGQRPPTQRLVLLPPASDQPVESTAPLTAGVVHHVALDDLRALDALIGAIAGSKRRTVLRSWTIDLVCSPRSLQRASAWTTARQAREFGEKKARQFPPYHVTFSVQPATVSPDGHVEHHTLMMCDQRFCQFQATICSPQEWAHVERVLAALKRRWWQNGE